MMLHLSSRRTNVMFRPYSFHCPEAKWLCTPRLTAIIWHHESPGAPKCLDDLEGTHICSKTKCCRTRCTDFLSSSHQRDLEVMLGQSKSVIHTFVPKFEALVLPPCQTVWRLVPDRLGILVRLVIQWFCQTFWRILFALRRRTTWFLGLALLQYPGSGYIRKTADILIIGSRLSALVCSALLQTFRF